MEEALEEEELVLALLEAAKEAENVAISPQPCSQGVALSPQAGDVAEVDFSTWADNQQEVPSLLVKEVEEEAAWELLRFPPRTKTQRSLQALHQVPEGEHFAKAWLK